MNVNSRTFECLLHDAGRKLAAGKREVVRKGGGGAKGPSKGSLGGFIVDDDVENSSEEESSESESDSSEGSSSESEEVRKHSRSLI